MHPAQRSQKSRTPNPQPEPNLKKAGTGKSRGAESSSKVGAKPDSPKAVLRSVGSVAPSRVAFLFDVDNTLLDNDQVTEDLRRHLEKEVGAEHAKRYWDLFEELRAELGYADYLGALQRYRIEYPHDVHLLTVSHFLINYPFAARVYPGALAAIERVQRWGSVAILSDGDVVFQPLKVERSGLRKAVAGRVLIYVHKEAELADVEQRYPAAHYVLLDDKLRILSAVKKIWGPRVTTAFVRQGHYALDPEIVAKYPPADLNFERIGEVAEYDFSRVVQGRVPASA
jgi:hypothetical protein